MTEAERFRRIDEVFRAALRLPAVGRQTFVERESAGDEAMAAEVLELLAEDEATKGVLDAPVLDIDVTASVLSSHIEERMPERIDRYRILSKIGEGGFGAVYLAEQEMPVRRRVALKVIKLGMDTRQVIARFEAERQALAMMDHPNIARVLDAGATESGRPYFVMELVKGEPITKFCDEQQLSANERLDLFIQVCHAVQHAHQKGVIHRDIKPSNVLVEMHDDKPVPKVIDFGIAKATSARLTEKTIFTEFRQLIGTPEYMSPEQAGGSAIDVDTRTDIYSLGVLLYELLTGTTPFDAKNLRSAAYDEIQRIIREVEPPKPSTRLSTMGVAVAVVARSRRVDARGLSRVVRGDLDWIVMKALEKNRTRRYETASEFARDIERHMRDEPVSAGPPGAAYRVSKFVRRHRTMVGVAAVIIITLFAATAVSIVFGVRASMAREAESRALQHEARARQIADRQASIATAVNDFLTRDLLAQAAPELNPVGANATVRQMLDRAAARISTGDERPPEVKAAVLSVIADTYFALGLYESAETLWRQAHDLHKALFGTNHAQTLHSLSGIAQSLDYQEHYREAAPMYRILLDTSDAVLGPEHQQTLIYRNNFAEFLRAQGMLDDAAAEHERILEIRERRFGGESTDTLETMNNLAAIYSMQDRLSEAESLFRKVLLGRQRLLGEEHPLTLITLSNLGVALRRQGKLVETEPIYRKVLEADGRVQGPEHPDTLTDMHNLASLLAAQGKLDEAEAMYREAVRLRRKILGETHPVVAHSLIGLGQTLCDQDQSESGEPFLREALEIRRSGLGGGHHLTADAAAALARSLVLQNRFEQAERVLTQSLHDAEGDTPDRRATETLYAALAALYEAWSRPDEASKWREILEKSRKSGLQEQTEMKPSNAQQ